MGDTFPITTPKSQVCVASGQASYPSEPEYHVLIKEGKSVVSLIVE